MRVNLEDHVVLRGSARHVTVSIVSFVDFSNPRNADFCEDVDWDDNYYRDGVL
jgi:hypothetical protein